jgi:hypothetical protein
MIGVVKPPGRHNEVSHLLVKGREYEPVFLDSHTPVLRFIQNIRDETHKAAITYHRKRREIRDFTSELTAIPGVGEKRKTRLLRNFGSITRISRAGVLELSPFVGREVAEEIVNYFKGQRGVAGVEEADADDNNLVENLQAKETDAAAVDDVGNVHQIIHEADADGAPLIVETRLDDPGRRGGRLAADSLGGSQRRGAEAAQDRERRTRFGQAFDESAWGKA